MKTWLLTAIDPQERVYRGHGGYEDDVTSVYRYDSFVPNHRNLSAGDAVILRDKTDVLGAAVIDRIERHEGSKKRQLCPTCGSTKLKARKVQKPVLRCECGSEFDAPVEREDECIEYEAWFGDSFRQPDGPVTIRQIWDLAPRLNKQHAMIEVDATGAASLLGTKPGSVAPPRSRKYWAFCANPGRYRIEDAVRERETDAWSIGDKDVRVGDRVIIWRAAGGEQRRGVLALGIVVSGPTESDDDSNDYWMNEEDRSAVVPRVRVRYVVPRALPLWIDGPESAVLEHLTVNRARGGTVFNVQPDEWNALVGAAGGWPPGLG